MKGRILWIEGKRADNPSFIPILRKKDFIVETVPTGAAALSHISDFKPDLVVVYAASLRTNGKRICCDLRQKHNKIPILLILNPEQSAGDDVCANTVLVLPFTQRKLVNRIMPLLPGDGENLIYAGTLRLDLERKRVRCQDKRRARHPAWHSSCLFLCSMRARWLNVRIFSAKHGKQNILAIHVLWMCISAGCARRSKQILVNRNL